MKWLFICIWLISILSICLRGKIKPTLSKTFIDHSIILAPLNALLILCSKEKFRSGLFISKEHFVDMELITENWRVFLTLKNVTSMLMDSVTGVDSVTGGKMVSQ